MNEDDDDVEIDESTIQAMEVLNGRSDAVNEFFIRMGEEILLFVQKNDLTIDQLAVSLGYLAGSFSICAMKASPEQYVQASDDYVILCDSGVEIGVARARIMHEEQLHGSNENPSEPTNR